MTTAQTSFDGLDNFDGFIAMKQQLEQLKTLALSHYAKGDKDAFRQRAKEMYRLKNLTLRGWREYKEYLVHIELDALFEEIYFNDIE